MAADLRAQLAALEASHEFRPWQRLHPDFKPRLSGLLATLRGPPRRVTVLLDGRSVRTAAPGGGQALAAPALLHLCLATRIPSHELRNCYVDGHVSLRSGPTRLQLDLLPAEARPTARAMSVLSHGGLRRLLRPIEPALPAVVAAGPAPLPPAPASP